jgi:hypothetical protein
VEPVSRHANLVERVGPIEGHQSSANPFHEIRPDEPRIVFQKKPSQTLVPKASDHDSP